MDSDLIQAQAILNEYINHELLNGSSLVEFIVNANMRKLILTNKLRETEDYKILLQQIFARYPANDINSHKNENAIIHDSSEVIQPEQNYVTLKHKQALSIVNNDVLHYEFRVNEQVIFSESSAQTIYKNILEYLMEQGNVSIIGKKYISMVTMEQWYELLGNSADEHIRDKYKLLGKHHMLFVSIVPAIIMKKLTYLFEDLCINLDDFRIYCKENVKMNDMIIRHSNVVSDKPDLIYNPNHEELFDRHADAFKRELLKSKRVKKLTYKTDGTVEEQIWTANNITSKSNLKANIVSNNKIRVYKREGTLDRIEFFIIR